MADDLSRELGDVSIELERVSDLAESVGKSLTSAFRAAIVDGRSLQGVLGDVSRAFADIALKAALKPVGLLIENGVETLFNGLNPALGGAAAAPVARAAAQVAGAVTHVTFNVTSPDARSFVASEAEVSAMLLRAVRRGTRAS
jgi:uncharacterized protein (DUF697 family)